MDDVNDTVGNENEMRTYKNQFVQNLAHGHSLTPFLYISSVPFYAGPCARCWDILGTQTLRWLMLLWSLESYEDRP